MPTIAVDGVSSSGKSIFLQALQQRALEVRPNYTKVVLTEHITERLFEKTVPSTLQVHAHVARVLSIALELDRIRQDGPFSDQEKIVTAMIERLFLTFLTTGRMKLSFFTEYGALVEKADIRSLLLLVPTEMMRERVASTLPHRNRAWREFVASIGGVEGAVERFNRQQEEMVAMNERLSTFVKAETIAAADTEHLRQQALLDDVLRN